MVIVNTAHLDTQKSNRMIFGNSSPKNIPLLNPEAIPLFGIYELHILAKFETVVLPPPHYPEAIPFFWRIGV